MSVTTLSTTEKIIQSWKQVRKPLLVHNGFRVHVKPTQSGLKFWLPSKCTGHLIYNTSELPHVFERWFGKNITWQFSPLTGGWVILRLGFVSHPYDFGTFGPVRSSIRPPVVTRDRIEPNITVESSASSMGEIKSPQGSGRWAIYL